MNKGICVAGNLIVDIIYPIERYPGTGELTTIYDGISRATGGLVCNCAVDIAKLDPTLPVEVAGLVGDDAEGHFILEKLSDCKNIDTSRVLCEGSTSFTAVMSDAAAGTRTFFQYRGANARFDANHIAWDALDCDLLHIGYILLLDALDEDDEVYGTKMAALLKQAKDRGIATSIDVVTESSERFVRKVRPALKYTDYCVINEVEAERTTGVALRGENGEILADNMEKALGALFDMGVGTWAVIHAPEGSWGMDASRALACLKGATLPKGYIKGSVGAGDAFCSGVLVGAYRGAALADALRMGTAAAVASLRCADATSGLVPMEEALENLEAYL